MQRSFSDLEYAAKKKVTRRDRFLGEIDAVTPWPALLAEVEPFYPKSEGCGRPPIALERMLRMYIAQQCFGLSDGGTEDAICDSQAIRSFVGIDLSREAAPDATTLLTFRRQLEAHQLTERIFAAINVHLAAKGLMLREETTVFGDAGYQSVDKREENRDSGVTWHVALRPGQRRVVPDSESGRLRERADSTQTKVEHPFHLIKNVFALRKTRYHGLAKNAAQLFTLFGLANLLIAKRRLYALHVQGAS